MLLDTVAMTQGMMWRKASLFVAVCILLSGNGTTGIKAPGVATQPCLSHTLVQVVSRLTTVILTGTIFSSSPALAAPLGPGMDNDAFVRAEKLAMEDGSNTKAKLVTSMNSFLTNPMLENIRLNSQKYPDVSATSKDANVDLFLVPILKLRNELNACSGFLSEEEGSIYTGIDSAKALLDPYDTPSLKKLFNRYSDNIFYSDPREANLYLSGGATPGSAQTTAYLYRNSIITGIMDVKDDIQSIRHSGSSRGSSSSSGDGGGGGGGGSHYPPNGGIGGYSYPPGGDGGYDMSGHEVDTLRQQLADTLDDLKEANESFDAYLELVGVGPEQLKAARRL
jgi:hypothetical protein